MSQKGRLLGEVLADVVAEKIGTWTFLAVSTGGMGVWIGVNSVRWWLQVDPPPFQGWNLFLSWWAGCTVSILLIAGKRQAAKDHKTLQSTEHHAREAYLTAAKVLAMLERHHGRSEPGAPAHRTVHGRGPSPSHVSGQQGD